MSRNSYSSWKIILVLSHSESTVGRFRTRGESEVSSEMQARKHASRGSVLNFETHGKCYQISKTGVSECIPVGYVLPTLYCTGGSLSRGSLFMGVSIQWESLSREVSGGSLSRGSLSGRPHHPCGQADSCENITLPQTLFAGGKKIVNTTSISFT